jgi:hypothetical protein
MVEVAPERSGVDLDFIRWVGAFRKHCQPIGSGANGYHRRRFRFTCDSAGLEGDGSYWRCTCDLLGHPSVSCEEFVCAQE